MSHSKQTKHTPIYIYLHICGVVTKPISNCNPRVNLCKILAITKYWNMQQVASKWVMSILLNFEMLIAQPDDVMAHCVDRLNFTMAQCTMGASH